MIQLRAFGPDIVKKAYLMAPESRRQAFYTLWIETAKDGYRVWRESGGMGKVWQRQAWEFSSLEEAERFFNRRIKNKTNPERKSKRKYRVVYAS